MLGDDKKARLVAFALLFLLLSSSFLIAGHGATQTTTSPKWAFDAPQYPTGSLRDASCVSSAGYIYCVGGSAPQGPPPGTLTPISSVYFAKETQQSSGSTTSSTTSGQPVLGPWTLSPNPYPVAVSQEACVSSSGFIYCVGGCVGPSSPCTLTSAVYYAPLTSSGVGKWTPTSSYPYAIGATNCVTNAAIIYCIGALSDIGGRGVDAGSYYAPITATGVGKWNTAGAGVYATYGSCVTAAGYVYCIGGTTGFDAGHNTTYYAPLLTTGIGNWAKTTSYPMIIFRVSCAVDSVTVYCVGPTGSNACISSGACPTVYTAALSATGIGPWASVANGPASVQSNQSCLVDAGFLYCIGAIDVTQTSKTNLVAYYPLSSRTPIIFLPGVAGTQLLNGSKEVWPYVTIPNVLFGFGTAANSRFLPMKLDSTGTLPANPSSKISAGYVLCPPGSTGFSGSYVCSGATDFYGGLMKNLTGQGYTIGKDLYEFGYDWRINNQVHFSELDQLIGTAMKTSGSNKTILMAHSMGGVISRGYLFFCNANPGSSSCKNYKHVTTLITIGTPNFGAPKVYYGVLMGYNFGNPKAGIDVMKDMLQNFEAAYQLLPKAPFAYPYPSCSACPSDRAPNGALDLNWTYSVMYKSLSFANNDYTIGASNLWSMNKLLLDQSFAYYSLMGTPDNPTPLPSGVKYYAIIGYGVSTLTSYLVRDGTAADTSYLQAPSGRHVVLEPVFADGDGTVPMWSLKMDPATQYFVPYVSGYVSDTSSKHGDLPENPTVQALVKSILDGKPLDASGFAYHKGTLVPNKEVTGVSSWTSDTIDFVLHSNAELTVVDGHGAVLGYNASSDTVSEGMGTGTFLRMDTVEYASMRNIDRPYLARVQGTSSGEFSLTVRVTGNSGSESFTYPNVQVSKGTSATLNITGSSVLSASSPPALIVSTGGASMLVQAANVTLTSGTTSGSGSSPSIPSLPSIGNANFSSIPQLLPAQVLNPLMPYLRPISSATGVRPDLIVVGIVVLLILVAAIARVARRSRRKK